MTTYSNPRTASRIDNWPLGGTRRGTAVFAVEADPKRGERGTRYTIDPRTNKPSATKKLTYASTVRIVDGDDGKTYFAELSSYGFLMIMQGNAQFQAERIAIDDPRWLDMMRLLDQPDNLITAWQNRDRREKERSAEWRANHPAP